MSEEKKSINNELKDVSGGEGDLINFKLGINYSKTDTKIDNSTNVVVNSVSGDINMN